MKRIALLAKTSNSEDNKIDSALQFISGSLLDSTEKKFFLSAHQIATESFDAVVVSGDFNEAELREIILDFNKLSKPIGVLGKTVIPVAKILSHLNPTIAINEMQTTSLNFSQLGIEAIVCPADDFITDRYTKLISISLPENCGIDCDLDRSTQHGLTLFFKELVEIA